MSTNVSSLNIFTDQNGNFGNPVDIIIDLERQLSDEERLRKLLYSNKLVSTKNNPSIC